MRFLAVAVILGIALLCPNHAHADSPYIVETGDCLWNIGQRFGYSVSYLATINGIANPALIFPGQIIRFDAADTVTFALAQIGKPYVWAGSGPNGYDCSGLVSAAYAQMGVYLPHNAYLQWQRATTITQPQRGDLAFYNKGNYIVHVGLMIDSTRMVHATSRYGEVVIESPWAYANLYSFGRF